MTYNQQLEVAINLPFDQRATVYQNSEYTIYLFRPSKPSSRFKFYDPKRNFQIWLDDGKRTFKPNHLRVMIDLYLRVRSRPDLKRNLAIAFDRIFYGDDPLQAISLMQKEDFPHFLNSLDITAQLAQLFIIEQDYGYHKPSKYSPPTLFFQGWIRQIFDSSNEIDDIIMSIASRRPPAPKYTREDDKNHKQYKANVAPLWWLSS